MRGREVKEGQTVEGLEEKGRAGRGETVKGGKDCGRMGGVGVFPTLEKLQKCRGGTWQRRLWRAVGEGEDWT